MIAPSAFIRLTVFALLSGLIIIVLGGCATDQPIQPPATPSIVTKLQLVQPSAALLADCDVKTAPPDPDSFAGKQFDVTPLPSATADSKTIATLQADVRRLRFQLGLTVDYASALQTDLKDCMAHPKVLRDWFSAEVKLYPSP